MNFFKKLLGLEKKEEEINPAVESQEMTQPVETIDPSSSESTEVDGVDVDMDMGESTEESSSESDQESSSDDEQVKM